MEMVYVQIMPNYFTNLSNKSILNNILRKSISQHLDWVIENILIPIANSQNMSIKEC